MKLITIYNADATDSLVIHNITSDIGYFITPSIQGLESPAISTSTIPLAGTHGAFIPTSLYRERRITIEGILSGSITTYNQRRRDLEEILAIERDQYGNLKKKTLKFTTDDDLQLQVAFTLGSAIKLPIQYIEHGYSQLDLIAPDLVIVSQTTTSQNFTSGVSGGWTLPVTLPAVWSGGGGGASATVNNAGNGPAFPTITFNGPVTNPRLLNVTTGLEMAFTRTLSSGQSIVVDMWGRTAVQDSGTNVIQYMTNVSRWWWLQPGNNNISFGSSSSADTGVCTLSFRDSYIGL